MRGEPSLDELLGDEIMDRVMRRAGTDATEMRRRMTELAHRLGLRRPPLPSRGRGA
jgi:hypothetical protein